MNPLRLLADLLYRANQRRIERGKKQREDAAIARYEKMYARCLHLHGDACPGSEANGDCHD